MTIASSSSLFGIATSAVTGFAVQAQASDAGPSPWWLGVILALGGFVALMVRWMMGRQDALVSRQDAMHDENRREAARREERWQAREDERTEIHQTQVAALHTTASNLTSLGQQIDGVPRRVADEIHKRGQ